MNVYHVVGGGIAGSMLATMLIQRNEKVTLYNQFQANSGSLNASGMVNTLSSKLPTETHLAGEAFLAFQKFVYSLPLDLQSFWHPIGILHPFSSIFEFNNWSIEIANQSCLQNYIDLVLKIDTDIELPFGGFLAKDKGWLDLPNFIPALHLYLSQFPNFQLVNDNFYYQDIINADFDSISEIVIFCEGHWGVENPFFENQIQKVKGTYIWVEIDDFKLDCILWKHYHLIPMQNNIFRFGSTFIFENSIDIKNEVIFLEKELVKLIKKPVKTHQVFTGFRASSKNRRPLFYKHPQIKNIWFFNNLGSKGILNAALLTKMFLI